MKMAVKCFWSLLLLAVTVNCLTMNNEGAHIDSLSTNKGINDQTVNAALAFFDENNSSETTSFSIPSATRSNGLLKDLIVSTSEPTTTKRVSRLVMNNQGAVIQNQQGNDFTGLFGKRSVDGQETTLGTATTRKVRLVMNNQGAMIKNQQGNDFSGLFGGKRSVDGQETTVSTGTTRKARLVMNNQGAFIKNQQGNDFSGLFGGKRSIDIKKQINNQGGEPEMMRVSQDPFGGKRSFDNMDNELLKHMGIDNQAGVSQDLFGRKRSVGSGAEKTENSRESRGTVNNQGSQIGNQNVADFGNLVGGFFDN